jgi:hypothetical protein
MTPGRLREERVGVQILRTVAMVAGDYYAYEFFVARRQ